ncbi:MAG: chemotaxis response regulator protein-glutamate methylesterase [Gammaproteobacteria bacterium]|nr:chemotaxis response regulator protein-glutamate methylesterase [Gammaproteobacteria bacterium]
MTVKVLVVDDSGFFRRRVIEMLNGDSRIEVVGQAADGREAIKKTQELKPDVITMDIEMPVMDGITSVRRIMAIQPTPILMFSSLTHEGAQSTFSALEAGAVDYLPKDFHELSSKPEEITRILCSRVWSIGNHGSSVKKRPASAPVASTVSATKRTSTVAPSTVKTITSPSRSKGHYKILAIGSSTGGPVALQEVLTKLPANFSLPIVLVQHMPGSFTEAFANRLNQMSKIEIREAKNGDQLKPGLALLAPGGKQMLIEGRGNMMRVRIQESDPGQNYKPCVDLTFNSIAKIMPANTLAIILTGMGADGREGAKLLQQGGSTIWAQDKESSVIYGMPMAIAEAGIAEKILPLSEFGTQIVSHV